MVVTMLDILLRYSILDACITIIFNGILTSFSTITTQSLIKSGAILKTVVVDSDYAVNTFNGMEHFDLAFYGDVCVIDINRPGYTQIKYDILTLVQTDDNDVIVYSVTMYDGVDEIALDDIIEIQTLDGVCYTVGP